MTKMRLGLFIFNAQPFLGVNSDITCLEISFLKNI